MREPPPKWGSISNYIWVLNHYISRYINTPQTNGAQSDGIELRTRSNEGETYVEVTTKDGKEGAKAKLLVALLKTFWPMGLLSAFYKVIFDIFQFVQPLILK